MALMCAMAGARRALRGGSRGSICVGEFVEGRNGEMPACLRHQKASNRVNVVAPFSLEALDTIPSSEGICPHTIVLLANAP